MDENSTTGTTQYSDSSYSFKSDVSSEGAMHQTPLSPTFGMSVRTITLPETHIFTPEKCTNAISQSVDRGDEWGGGKIKENATIVKEYHDVEYKLDKSVTSDCLSSINSVSSEISVLNHFNSLSQPALVSSSVDPIIDSLSSKMMTLKPEPVKSHNVCSKNIKKDNFPIFGTSPTDMGEEKKNDDDDFCDFQAAPTIKPMEPIKPKPLQATSLLNPLPLSPVHLMRSAANSTLPEPDDDEMLRIEAFARSKSQKSSNNNTDDDEWTDFTSAIPVSQPPPKTFTTNNKNDDDWSDFVFTTPASSMNPTIIPNHHRHTQNMQKVTNPSWNHQIFTQGNYMPWSTSTGQVHQFPGASGTQQNTTTTMPELNFIQSQKSYVNAPNRHPMMRK